MNQRFAGVWLLSLVLVVVDGQAFSAESSVKPATPAVANPTPHSQARLSGELGARPTAAACNHPDRTDCFRLEDFAASVA